MNKLIALLTFIFSMNTFASLQVSIDEVINYQSNIPETVILTASINELKISNGEEEESKADIEILCNSSKTQLFMRAFPENIYKFENLEKCKAIAHKINLSASKETVSLIIDSNNNIQTLSTPTETLDEILSGEFQTNQLLSTDQGASTVFTKGTFNGDESNLAVSCSESYHGAVLSFKGYSITYKFDSFTSCKSIVKELDTKGKKRESVSLKLNFKNLSVQP